MTVWRGLFPLTTLVWRDTLDGQPASTVVRLEQRSAASAANIRQLPGFDELQLAFTAYLDTPKFLPNNLTMRSRAPFTVLGVAGSLRIVPSLDTSHEAAKDILGEQLSLAWFSSQGR